MPLWGKTDNANGVPKYIAAADLASTYFADTTEIAIAANRAKGLQTPGWLQFTTYTDSSGNTRRRVETLVVMKVAAGTSGDAADDAVLADT